MIKLDTLQEICTGLAWANQSNPLKEEFEVDVTLPFPFYEALQRELIATMANSATVIDKRVDTSLPMKFAKVQFPNGIRMNVKQSKDILTIQVVRKPKLDASQLLLPFNSERV